MVCDLLYDITALQGHTLKRSITKHDFEPNIKTNDYETLCSLNGLFTTLVACITSFQDLNVLVLICNAIKPTRDCLNSDVTKCAF